MPIITHQRFSKHFIQLARSISTVPYHFKVGAVFETQYIKLATTWYFNFFATQCYAERGNATVYCLSVCLPVCLSVCPSVRLPVTFRYRHHISWNSSKIISRPNSLRPLRWLTPTWVIWCNGSTPKIWVE